MAWRIEFVAGALKDLRRLDRQVAHRITQFLRERLAVMDDPRALGASLRSPRSGPGAAPLWRYRVGDWRIVVCIENEVLRVLAGQIFVLLRVVSERSMARDGCSS